MSGCSATNCLTSPSCAARAYCLYPPNLAGLTLPVSRCSLRKRTTELILTPSCSAVSGMVVPSCPARTTRARRSSEYGFPIPCWPPFPVRILNLIRRRRGIHPDSVFSGNALAARGHEVAQFVGDPRKHRVPVAALGLTKQPHLRIPWAVLAIGEPA